MHAFGALLLDSVAVYAGQNAFPVGPRTAGQTAMRGVVAGDVAGSVAVGRRTLEFLVQSGDHCSIGVRTTRQTEKERRVSQKSVRSMKILLER